MLSNSYLLVCDYQSYIPYAVLCCAQRGLFNLPFSIAFDVCACVHWLRFRTGNLEFRFVCLWFYYVFPYHCCRSATAIAVTARFCVEVRLCCLWLPNLKPMKTAEIYTLLNCVRCANRIVIIDSDDANGDHDDDGDDDKWSFYNVNRIAFMYDITVVCYMDYHSYRVRWRQDKGKYTCPLRKILTFNRNEKDQLCGAQCCLRCTDSWIVFYLSFRSIPFHSCIQSGSVDIYSFMAVLLSVRWCCVDFFPFEIFAHAEGFSIVWWTFFVGKVQNQFFAFSPWFFSFYSASTFKSHVIPHFFQ